MVNIMFERSCQCAKCLFFCLNMNVQNGEPLFITKDLSRSFVEFKSFHLFEERIGDLKIS